MNMATSASSALANLSSNSCALCGQDAKAGSRFCCIGCSNVYTILEESGILIAGVDPRSTDLFKRSLELGLISNAPESKTFTIPDGAEQRELLLGVSGMWCAACAWLIERTLRKLPGVTAAEVMFASDLVRIRYAPRYLPVEKISAAIDSLGYRTGDFSARETEYARLERRDLLMRAGVAAFLWLNVMTFSTIFYVSYFEFVTDSFRRQMPFVLMLLTLPAIVYSAQPILRAAWLGARQRIMRMETLLSIGIFGAYAYSTLQAFTGGKHYYFDTACAIITLVLAGKLIERSAKERTSQAITALYRMMPSKARVLLSGGRERFVSVDHLELASIILVKPGERIPADGLIEEGVTHVDESVLTGESTPVSKHRGDNVVCGSLVASNPIRIRVTRVGKDSTLNQIIVAVEAALASRTSIERTVDRVSRKFIPAVVGLALLTFFGWWMFKGDVSAGLVNAIAVLVIACPCALGIATPLALTSAIGVASRKGILVNDVRVLESLPTIDYVVFDKTGTVTDGEFGVVDIVCADRLNGLRYLAALETTSEHPIARTLVQYAALGGVPVEEPATQVSRYDGQGLTGMAYGRRVFAGNLALAFELGIFVPPELSESMTQWEMQGHTAIVFGVDLMVLGAVAFGNRVRPEAHGVLQKLRWGMGVETAILSGDSIRTTSHVASQLAAGSFHSEMVPADKVRWIQDLQGKGHRVAMVGDGVNDAQALAQANLGIAMGTGTALAMRAAPLVLMGNNLNRIVDAIDLANQTMRVVRQNLFWAFFYNIAGLALAVTGLINPIIAAGAMVLSSMTVIANSLRLSRR
jgi:heavy metal translocating P-type ATPase